MRTLIFSLTILAFAPWAAVPAAGAAELQPEQTAHPGTVALVQYGDDWVYVHAETSLRLYVFDEDPPGKSTCNAGCAAAWPPLFIDREDAPETLGFWSIIKRDDGRRQWAYKDRPVYLRYHDSLQKPVGLGYEGWNFLEP